MTEKLLVYSCKSDKIKV